jgi:hypothetical protein
MILNIFAMGHQPFGDAPPRIGFHALKGAGEIQSHNGRGIIER